MQQIFSTDYAAILQQVEDIDPISYGKTRNFINGAVTRLSPYISRGVISTQYVLQSVLKRNFKLYQVEKFIQELAWRDYWQQIWVAKASLINTDLTYPQADAVNQAMPLNIINACTGIKAIDNAITSFYKTGYMHNHMRMYVAALACNIAKSRWKVPAQWMYFYLLDADWASNALSWQWVAATNSSKKYFANQENINKYFGTSERGTYLDKDYNQLTQLAVPDELKQPGQPDLTTTLPAKLNIEIDKALPACIYNFYNLDPLWKQDIKANRILLLEPSHFEQYPVSARTIDFLLKLSTNIKGMQVYTGSFNQLVTEYNISHIFFKEHPLNRHYKGTEENRDWMFELPGYYSSFFSYWKQGAKQLKQKETPPANLLF